MPADYQLSLNDYLSIIRRRAWVIVLTFVVVLGASVVVALILPRAYQASGTLLAEGPQIAGEVVQPPSGGNAEQRVQALRQRIMTRESLLRIAAEHRVFEPPPGIVLKDTDIETHLVVSRAARMTLSYETDLSIAQVEALATVTHPEQDIGAACSSGVTAPSPVLLAMYPDEPWRAASCLRLSFGPETPDAASDRVLEAAARVLARSDRNR